MTCSHPVPLYQLLTFPGFYVGSVLDGKRTKSILPFLLQQNKRTGCSIERVNSDESSPFLLSLRQRCCRGNQGNASRTWYAGRQVSKEESEEIQKQIAFLIPALQSRVWGAREDARHKKSRRICFFNSQSSATHWAIFHHFYILPAPPQKSLAAGN